jgi:hypothetical protein
MITFNQAFSLLCPDVEEIASLTGIPPHQVDRSVNDELRKKYLEKKDAIRKQRVAS